MLALQQLVQTGREVVESKRQLQWDDDDSMHIEFRGRMVAELLLDLRRNFVPSLRKVLLKLAETALAGRIPKEQVTDLAKITVAYLSPRFLKHYPYMLHEDSVLFLDAHTALVRRTWLRAIQPLVHLLKYIIFLGNRRIQAINNFDEGNWMIYHPAVYKIAGRKDGWKTVLRTREWANRALPFIRFAGLYLSELVAEQADELPSIAATSARCPRYVKLR